MATVHRYPDAAIETWYERELEIIVDRERAGFSAWYELFPRSWSPIPGKHGTLQDVANRLEYVAEMGFDVLYLPPISPIGKSFRKGKNNAVEAAPGDVGSPWAIGSAEGGHTSILPELGTLKDFANLVKRAKQLKMEVALDIAFQCAPDHPWVKEHPEFFKKRPDGSIQYAENPPKKYQDIYPLDFESSNWQGLWEALKGVFTFWMDQGVLIFRVDNPHTKAFPFWQWVIPELKAKDPNVLFLAEAFTRPRVMERLAKVGFSESYTYFTWRDSKQEITEYMLELTTTPVREYFRPNFWPNTPDILPIHLQTGGLPAFRFRLVLAATLSCKLRDLRAGLRAGRKYSVQTRRRRIPELREIRDQAVGFDQPGKPETADHPVKPDSGGKPGAPEQRAAALPPYGQSDADLLLQANGGWQQPDPRGGQPRSFFGTGGVG